MDSSPNGSFIPKRSVNKPAAKIGRKIYIFSYVAYVVFFGTMLSVVGVFVIDRQVDQRLQEYVIEVDGAQSLFDRNQIDSLVSLDRKLNLASRLLDNHVAVSIIFEALEEAVLRDVKFNSFTYTRDYANSSSVSIEAQAEDFDKVIVQRDDLLENPVFSNVNFMEVTYGNDTQIDEETSTSLLSGGEELIQFNILNNFAISDIAYQPPADNVDLSGFDSVTDNEQIGEDEITDDTESAADDVNQ